MFILFCDYFEFSSFCWYLIVSIEICHSIQVAGNSRDVCCFPVGVPRVHRVQKLRPVSFIASFFFPVNFVALRHIWKLFWFAAAFELRKRGVKRPGQCGCSSSHARTVRDSCHQVRPPLLVAARAEEAGARRAWGCPCCHCTRLFFKFKKKAHSSWTKQVNIPFNIFVISIHISKN